MEIQAQFSVDLQCGLFIDVSYWQLSWTLVACQLSEIHDDRQSFWGVTPFYLTVISWFLVHTAHCNHSYDLRWLSLICAIGH